MDKKYVTIQYIESYGDRYLTYYFGDKLPAISEKKRDNILHVFEIADSKTVDNFDYIKYVFKKAFFKNLKVLCGANPNIKTQEDFSLCINETTGKYILMTISHVYQLGNEVQPTIRKSSKSEEKQDQARNTKKLFDNIIKSCFEEVLHKYGAEIDDNPYRFSETGSKRNYIALDINFDKLKQIIADELTKAFGVKVKLESGSTSFHDNEFAQLDVTQLLQRK